MFDDRNQRRRNKRRRNRDTTRDMNRMSGWAIVNTRITGDSSQLTHPGDARRRRCRFRIKSQSTDLAADIRRLLPLATHHWHFPFSNAAQNFAIQFRHHQRTARPPSRSVLSVRTRSHVVIAFALVTHGSATAVICVHWLNWRVEWETVGRTRAGRGWTTQATQAGNEREGGRGARGGF